MNPPTAAPPETKVAGTVEPDRRLATSATRTGALLTGEALFVDDVHLEGMLHAAFVRSDYAHGILNGVNLSAALEHPGVEAAYAAQDLGDYWEPGPLLVPPPPIERLEFHAATQVPLARDKVRHVGEPIAVVVARSRYEAEDAAALVEVDIDPLPAVADLTPGLEPDAPRIHDQLESNLAAHVIQEKGAWEAAGGEHVHFVDDVDLEARRCWGVADAVDRFRGCRRFRCGSQHPSQARRCGGSSAIARYRPSQTPQGVRRGPAMAVGADAVECPRNDPCGAGLAYCHGSPVSMKRVSQIRPRAQGIAQRSHQCILADQLGEAVGR